MNQLGNVRTAQTVHSCAATRLRRWQRVFRSAISFGVMAFATSAFAAIPIGEGVNGPFTFDTAPGSGDWTTISLAGGGTTFTSIETLTTGIQGLDAAAITTPLPTSGTNPP